MAGSFEYPLRTVKTDGITPSRLGRHLPEAHRFDEIENVPNVPHIHFPNNIGDQLPRLPATLSRGHLRQKRAGSIGANRDSNGNWMVESAQPGKTINGFCPDRTINRTIIG
jgi:hypothetical protein